MTRKGIVAAAIGLGMTASAPAARAYVWPQASRQAVQYEAEVPAGALPPGAAVADMLEGPSHFRTRFEMPATGRARVRLWADNRYSGPPEDSVDVLVTSAGGATIHVAAARKQGGRSGAALYLGAADDLAALSRAVETSKKASAMLEGVELGASSEISAPDCRRLAAANFVIAVVRGGGARPGPLLACAARGAHLIVIGLPAGAPDAATKTFMRLAPRAGIAVPWGAGSVAWLPDLRAGAVDVVERLETRPGDSLASLVPGAHRNFSDDDDEVQPQPKGVPGSGVLLALLALYVAVIGPIGYFVGVRPRRAWLAWSWFPMIALAATAAFAGVSALWHSKPTELGVERMSLLAPTGDGLEAIGAHLEGNGSGGFSFSFPCQEGDLTSVERGFRFGTPFTSPAGSLLLTDDRVVGRLAVDGLSVGRYGSAGVGWVSPVARAAPELIRRGTALVVVNHTAQTLARAVVRTSELCGVVGAIIPGAGGHVFRMDCDSSNWPAADQARWRWQKGVMDRLEHESVQSGSYLLVADVDDPAAQVDVRPAIAVRASELVAIRGPLGEAAP